MSQALMNTKCDILFLWFLILMIFRKLSKAHEPLLLRARVVELVQVAQVI